MQKALVPVVFLLAVLPTCALAQTQPPPAKPGPSKTSESSQPVAETPLDPDLKAYSDQTVRQAMHDEIEARGLESRLKAIKVAAEIAKAQAELAKAAGRPLPGANATPAANATPGANAGAQALLTPDGLPRMSILWIAGPSESLQAQIRIAGYGSVVVRKDSQIPSSNGLVVDAIRSTGVTVVDRQGQKYEVGFAN